MLASPVPPEAVVSMRLSALVVDLAVLGPQAWSVARAPLRGAAGARDRRLHRPLDRRPARARAAPRRRRLDHQALSPRGGDRARAERRAPPPAQREPRPRPRRCWRARSRSARTASRRSSGEQSIDLTRREFELIELLASAEGRVLEREEIYSRLWGYTMVRGDRSVDVFVRKLRQKLEKASPSWRYIHTHFGIGYRFAAESLEVVDPDDVPSSVPVGLEPRVTAPAIRASSRGAAGRRARPPRQARPHRLAARTASPPFFRSTRPPVSSPTTPERSGSWPTSSTRPSRGHARRAHRAPRRQSKPPASGA